MTDAKTPGPYPDDRTGGDIAHDLWRAAAEATPFAGGLLSHLIDHYWRSTIERRQLDWHNSVDECLTELADRVEGVEEVLESDSFLDLFLKASVAAQQTNEEETRRRLRNAIGNAALKTEPEEWQHVFVSILGELRPVHMQLLVYLQNPKKFLEAAEVARLQRTMGTSVRTVAAAVFSDWSDEFFAQVARTLSDHGLIQNIGGVMSGRGAISSRTTDLGNRLLAFTSEP